MEWFNPPPSWSIDGDTISVTAGPKTDFWRTTHYGFVRDDGHLFGQQVAGDWSAEVVVRGAYATLYDQAGLMIRRDERTWVKCGIEYVEGVHHVSAVVTRDFSDWSVVALPEAPAALWLRASRQGDTVEVAYALDGAHYTMLRLAYFPPGEPVQVGVMCAAPQGEGFLAQFTGFAITPNEKEH